jgi:hypothetical protein
VKKNKLRNSYPELKNTKKKRRRNTKRSGLYNKRRGFCNCDEIKANLSLKAREGKQKQSQEDDGFLAFTLSNG